MPLGRCYSPIAAISQMPLLVKLIVRYYRSLLVVCYWPTSLPNVSVSNDSTGTLRSRLPKSIEFRSSVEFQLIFRRNLVKFSQIFLLRSHQILSSWYVRRQITRSNHLNDLIFSGVAGVLFVEYSSRNEMRSREFAVVNKGNYPRMVWIFVWRDSIASYSKPWLLQNCYNSLGIFNRISFFSTDWWCKKVRKTTYKFCRISRKFQENSNKNTI